MGKHQNSSEPAILKAAEKVFLEKGLEGARTAEIAREAGVNTGVLHYFFKTKEALFNRIIQERYLDFSHSLVLSLQDVSGNLEETVRAVSENVFDFFMENPDLTLFIYKEYPSHPEQVKMLGKAVREAPDAPVSRLQKAVEAEGITKFRAGTLFYMIVSFNLFGALSVRMSQDLGINLSPTQEEYVGRMREYCVHMILELINREKPNL